MGISVTIEGCLGLTDYHCRETRDNFVVSGQLLPPFGHSAVKTTVWADGGRCDKVMPNDAQDDTFRVGGNYSPHRCLSYLLVLRVLWPEVAAHNLEFHVEMRQPVKQVDPPRRGVIHHGSHLCPPSSQRSRRSRVQNSHADTVERCRNIRVSGYYW